MPTEALGNLLLTRAFIAFLLFSAVLGTAVKGENIHEKQITVFAAASLTDVLPVLAKAWTKDRHTSPRLSFGPSATMARQIITGAPAQLYISANPHWVYLVKEKLGLSAEAQPVTANTLVLVTPVTDGQNSAAPLTARQVSLLLKKHSHIAIANPALAPAGDYAQTYLKEIGLWGDVKGKLAFAGGVRHALALAEKGGLPAFVYGSDAAASSDVQIIGTVPDNKVPPIIYMALALNKKSLGSLSFLNFLSSDAAHPIWQKYGFSALPEKLTLPKAAPDHNIMNTTGTE